MKKYLILFALLPIAALAQKTPSGVTYEAKIIRVTDGDTVVIAAPFLPAPLKPELAVRIYGVDTPEKGSRAKCPDEATRAKTASDYTRGAVKATKQHQVVLYSWDKYGGRVLGDIVLDGISLRQELIRHGLAREYYGGAKTSWCK